MTDARIQIVKRSGDRRVVRITGNERDAARPLLAQDVRGYLKALLGDEQFADIFKARKFDFIDGLELFAYLYAEVTKSRVDEGFRVNLAKYLPDVDWDAAEASE